MLRLLLHKRENSWLHCTFGCATLKYSLGILELPLYQKENSWLLCTFGCATLKYSLGILKLLLYQKENSGLHCTFGCATLRCSLGILKINSLDPCLLRREVDARIKDEHTSWDPFDDYMAAVHRSQISVMQHSSRELEAIDAVLWRLKAYLGIFTTFVVNKYSKEPNSRKESEVHFSRPPSYLHQRHILKSSLGRKREHCPDPNETTDKNINHEFPAKIVVI